MNSITASPCTQVCEIESVSGYCTGCGRTLDEIAEWSSACPVRRQAILDALAERLAQVDQPGATAHGVWNFRDAVYGYFWICLRICETNTAHRQLL